MSEHPAALIAAFFVGFAVTFTAFKLSDRRRRIQAEQQKATAKIPCPVRWPDCSPDGCSKCDGKGYTEELRH